MRAARARIIDLQALSGTHVMLSARPWHVNSFGLAVFANTVPADRHRIGACGKTGPAPSQTDLTRPRTAFREVPVPFCHGLLGGCPAGMLIHEAPSLCGTVSMNRGWRNRIRP